MSQFIFFVTESELKISPLINAVHPRENSDFLYEVAQEIIDEKYIHFCWYLFDQETMNSDTIFTDSQRQLCDGLPFEDTRIGQVLAKNIGNCHEIIIWYGNDFEDLPYITNEGTFMELVEEQLQEDSGEIYMAFSKLEK